jgi:hypothetical protein
MSLVARKDTVDERRAHCDPCEHNKMGICKRCGCIIQAKTRLANQRCPIGLWGQEEYGLKSLKFR